MSGRFLDGGDGCDDAAVRSVFGGDQSGLLAGRSLDFESGFAADLDVVRLARPLLDAARGGGGGASSSV